MRTVRNREMAGKMLDSMESRTRQSKRSCKTCLQSVFKVFLIVMNISAFLDDVEQEDWMPDENFALFFRSSYHCRIFALRFLKPFKLLSRITIFYALRGKTSKVKREKDVLVIVIELFNYNLFPLFFLLGKKTSTFSFPRIFFLYVKKMLNVNKKIYNQGCIIFGITSNLWKIYVNNIVVKSLYTITFYSNIRLVQKFLLMRIDVCTHTLV